MAAVACVCAAAIVGTSSRASRVDRAPVPRPNSLRDAPMKRLTNTVHSFLRAGVPRRTAVAAASTVGAMGSFTTLALAYREPLNRCRCDATTSERVEDDADEPEEPRDEARKTKTKKKQSKSPFRAHCPKCRKRTNAGVALSFLFSPLYVAIASGITAAAAHAAGARSLRLARGLAADARARFTTTSRA